MQGHVEFTNIPPLRNLLREAEIDAHIADSRGRYAEAFDEFERWKQARIERRAKPSVIDTKPPLWALLVRWIKGLRVPLGQTSQHLAVKAVRGQGAPTTKGES